MTCAARPAVSWTAQLACSLLARRMVGITTLVRRGTSASVGLPLENDPNRLGIFRYFEPRTSPLSATTSRPDGPQGSAYLSGRRALVRHCASGFLFVTPHTCFSPTYLGSDRSRLFTCNTALPSTSPTLRRRALPCDYHWLILTYRKG